ncbi:hypothetical protein SAMN05443248_2000 [Bradyrhizobium erythrophlei]|jgi:hypothetical protein|uniref:Uncharacterized protein n=1 Tax=Bradyrhizobium erythrophlei TaxID=1437360 RepID=A0A1M5KWR4_9BRAD|nr:hypothetical protein SAMN05443248_2000 [Bradyrhizobium erythrophlei]
MGVLFIVVVLCLIAFSFYWFPNFTKFKPNNGFGPDWDCTPVPRGQPICIKKLGQ